MLSETRITYQLLPSLETGITKNGKLTLIYITGTEILSKYDRLCLFNKSGVLFYLYFTFCIKIVPFQADLQ